MDYEKKQEEYLNLYNEYSDAIFRYFFFRLSSRELAKDMAQEAFVKVWEYYLDNDKIENFRAFLYRAAHNLLIDYYRKKKESSLDDLQEKGFDPPAEHKSLEAIIDAKEVFKVIENLDDKYKTVLIMRYINDLSVKEIAEILEEKENNISVRIHRGLQKAKDFI